MNRFNDPRNLLKASNTPAGRANLKGGGNIFTAIAAGAPQPTAAQRAASEAENVAKVQKRKEVRGQFDKQVAASEERRNRRSLLGGNFGSLGGRSLLGG